MCLRSMIPKRDARPNKVTIVNIRSNKLRYNENEQAIRAERDQNHDGEIDIWYFYDQLQLTAIEEDTDHNGRVDTWEYFDDSEILTHKAVDLNGDGMADMDEYLKEDGGITN